MNFALGLFVAAIVVAVSVIIVDTRIYHAEIEAACKEKGGVVSWGVTPRCNFPGQLKKRKM